MNHAGILVQLATLCALITATLSEYLSLIILPSILIFTVTQIYEIFALSSLVLFECRKYFAF